MGIILFDIDRIYTVANLKKKTQGLRHRRSGVRRK